MIAIAGGIMLVVVGIFMFAVMLNVVLTILTNGKL